MITTYKELKEKFHIFRKTNAIKLKSDKLLILISKTPEALIRNNTVIFFFIYTAEMAIRMSNIDHFDIDQISVKLTQR